MNSTTSTAPQVLDNAALISHGGNATLAGTASDPDDPKFPIDYEYGGVVPRQDL